MRYLVYLIGFFILLPSSAAVFAVGKDALSNLDERRLALIIGNSRYDSLDNLPNVRNDTKLISSKLKKLGFKTKVVKNASREEMLLKIREFGEQLDDNDVGLFYYAGHAVEQDSFNYLVPSKKTGEIDTLSLESKTVGLNYVISQMRESESNISIIILDACRNRPVDAESTSLVRGFEQTKEQPIKTTGNKPRSRGLGQTKTLVAPTPNAKGMYIAYSTSSGSVATDGEYNNSPYARALANYIDQPGLDIDEVFQKVRNHVIEQTDNTQVPWEEKSLTADFYFSGEQTEEERSNELKAEAEIARLKEALQNERKAKVEAEKERQEALARLQENQHRLALERSLIEQQKLDELERLDDEELEKKRLKKEAEKAFAAEQKRRQKEIKIAKREQRKLEKAEEKRLAAVAKAQKLEEQKRLKAKAKQEAIARKEEKARRRSELAELRKIEKLKIAEQEKLVRLEAAKKNQAEQRAKEMEEARRKEQLALRKAELKQRRLAKAEAKKAKIAENKLKALKARELAAIAEAERIEARRLKEKRAKELKLAAQQAAQERKRLQQEQAAQLAEQKRKEKEAKKLAKLAEEEKKRIAREKQLIISMANNCDRLLSNASSGRKVLNCYRDVLEHDKNNAQATNGLLKLEELYQSKIAKSLSQGKLSRVNREFAVLESIDPVESQKMFGESVQSLQEELRKSSEESSRMVLPTF